MIYTTTHFLSKICFLHSPTTLHMHKVQTRWLHYKILYNFSNLFDGRVIQLYIFKDVILIVVAPLHLQRHTTFIYYKFMHCTPFHVCCFSVDNHIFFLPSFSQYPLLKIWRVVGVFHMLRLPAIAVITYVKTSRKGHISKHAI